jgi:hypothetical protein
LRALGKSERAHNHDQEAHVVSALLRAQLAAGQLEQVQSWWHWAARLLSGALSADARLCLLSEAVQTAVWLPLPDLSAQLRAALAVAPVGPLGDQARAALVEHLLNIGELSAAELLGRAWWQALSSRAALARGASLYVRLLRASGRVQEAQDEARASVHLSAGLPPEPVFSARLAWLMAISTDDAGDAAGILEGLQDLGRQRFAPAGSPASLLLVAYQALAHHRLGQPALAHDLIRDSGLSPLRLQNRLGLQAGEAALLTPPRAVTRSRTPVPELQLEFLGPASIRLRGYRLKLRPRFAELLVALALHPDGLTGEQLALSIYGETGNPNCCKTELSRLRQLLPVGTRPYRLTAPVAADFLEFPLLLTQGLSAATLALYRGPLLRASDAPVVREQREWLEELLRQQLLESPDPELSWRAAAHFPDDLQVWGALVRRLDQGDPRHHEAVARVALLTRPH